ncbi:thiosulfate sulfurtransferase/rhodanese-like domain-containing protein 3 isoform X2 [Bombina bombina]|uniref:thiosulfate sulfurtransferase/rhodanese-like domain-containing protein 3 isoform X2 n=1 Tax=Bombina bombina TaxID=8345 RepID=UPI00235AD692|nr:thiosulfate sulfurtransferase/rhodanese-like domain-containing protein 3 isoform X2 [Bombina bombina]
MCTMWCRAGSYTARVRALVLSPQIVIFRGFSSSLSETIKYEELKDLLKKESTFLIDVREPWEVKEYGVIRDSFNIPLGDLVQALQMDPKDFEEKYQTKMPIKSDTLVFSCLAGIRSKKALDTAVSLGFTSVQHYAGGLDDWAKHELPEKKP